MPNLGRIRQPNHLPSRLGVNIDGQPDNIRRVDSTAAPLLDSVDRISRPMARVTSLPPSPITLEERPPLPPTHIPLLFHWGDPIRSNAKALNDAGWPWRSGQADPHFSQLNGADGEVRNGVIGAGFMEQVRARANGQNEKGGVGYYTSTDIMRWMGWEGGFDLLVVEPQASNFDDLTRGGDQGPILQMAGYGLNPIIKRAPTPEEEARGIRLLVRPPTANDIRRIFPPERPELPDKAADSRLSFLENIWLRDGRIAGLGLDRRTPIVKDLFDGLLFDEGYRFLAEAMRDEKFVRAYAQGPRLKKLIQCYGAAAKSQRGQKIPDLAEKANHLRALLDATAAA